MSKMIFLCVLVAIISISFPSVTSKSIALEGNDFFLSVDPGRRDLLVKHFLTEALQRHQVFVVPDPRVANPIAEFGYPPLNFANNLLYWTRTSLGLDHTQIAAAIENNNVNTNSTGCNPQDIGCHCCPF